MSSATPEGRRSSTHSTTTSSPSSPSAISITGVQHCTAARVPRCSTGTGGSLGSTIGAIIPRSARTSAHAWTRSGESSAEEVAMSIDRILADRQLVEEIARRLDDSPVEALTGARLLRVADAFHEGRESLLSPLEE